MVNEELLERAERIACDANGDDEFVFAKVIFDLVDLVCALRKDRERLDWLEASGPSVVSEGRREKWATFTETSNADWRAVYERELLRDAIDAALSARGGEDGA